MRKLWALLALCWASLTHAQQNLDRVMLDQLLACSPNYFLSLKKNSHKLSAAGIELESSGSVARVKVKDRRDAVGTDWLIKTSSSLKLGLLEVVGFYDFERTANTYFALDWGLLVKGEPKDVAEQVNKLINSNHPLEFDGLLGFARLHRANTARIPLDWQVVKPLPAQAIPQQSYAELVLEVGLADESLLGISKLGCSLQGDLPKNLIHQVRPDTK